ncbi:auxin efflux carrier [Umbelopsis sp. PMI_123]|nr:auxin efflux carrier [Umbelopsis sp. PMI_123]
MVVVFLGWILSRQGYITNEKQKWLALLNMNFFTPCLLFTRMARSVNPEKILELWIIPVLYFVFAIISYGVAIAIARAAGLRRNDRNFLIASTMFSNTNSMPIAIMSGIISSQAIRYLYLNEADTKEDIMSRSVSYIVLFSLFGNILRWSYGYSLLRGEEIPYTVNKSSATNHHFTNYSVTTSASNTAISAPEHDFKSSPTETTHLLGNKQEYYEENGWLNRLRHIGTTIANSMTRPLSAALLALVVGFIPPLQRLLFAKDSIMYGSIVVGLESCGSASVPLVLVCLGAQLSTMSFERDSHHSKNIVTMAVIARMVLTPLISIVLVTTIHYYCQDIIGIAADPAFYLVLGLLSAMPTAISLTQIAQGGHSENLLVRTLFWGYGILFLPFCMLTMLILLSILDLIR